MLVGKTNIPAYINTEDGRKAFLVLSPDVYGRWTIGYHIWLGHTSENAGIYGVPQDIPFFNDCETIEEAIDMMQKALIKMRKPA